MVTAAIKTYDHKLNVLPTKVNANDHYFIKQLDDTVKHYIGDNLGNPLLVTAEATGSTTYTIINLLGADYTITQTTGTIIILCDATTNPISVNFPTAVGNKATITVKKLNTNSNNITINGLIDGETSILIKRSALSLTMISNNINWYII